MQFSNGSSEGLFFGRIFKEHVKSLIIQPPVNVEIPYGVIMDKRMRKNGSVILIVIFIIALMSTVIMGIAQINTEELLILNNHAGSTQAVEAGYAGLNDAFAELRSDSSWNTGFTDKSFNSGSYSVTVTGSDPDLTISSTAQTQQGFVANVQADITMSGSGPYAVKIDEIRINE